MGRHMKENARKNGYRLRLNEGELAMLAEIGKNTGMSTAAILRKGIKMQYKNLSKEENLMDNY